MESRPDRLIYIVEPDSKGTGRGLKELSNTSIDGFCRLKILGGSEGAHNSVQTTCLKILDGSEGAYNYVQTTCMSGFTLFW